MKEEDVYKDIIYAFKSNKLKFSAKDITNMIRNYMVYHKIYGISSVIFNKEDMNYYHFDSSTINIDYQLDLYDNVLDKENATFQMIAILTTILHEIE